jgi:bacterioferritin (cytochrome b1)
MKFHIPKQLKPVKERIDLKLERSLLERLDQYCRYMESDRDYVIGTVLQIVFKKDKGFSEWRRMNEPSVTLERSPRQARA